MKKKLFMLAALFTSWMGQNVSAANSYGIPDAIQDGNILHCFNWTMAEVKAELPDIAAAGYGSVQLSPLQRPDAKIGESWHALYRPYDLAFKSSGMGSEQDLQDFCAEAAKYGIKVVVDVVANHVDKTAGYHDTWWDSNGRVRWNGGIDYNNRYSVTHGQLGDYGDINSEDAEVCARGKAYVQKLYDLGVRGIRWDAAKHIGLPSESCNFWSTVTSVAGMWHYGEILDEPATGQGHLIKEYAQYMSVTDNKYSDGAAKDNGGIPYGYGGDWVVNQGIADNKVVYWGESHDTYSNDNGWSKYTDQSVIDRAYASFACRNGAAALYLARPDATDFNSIKVGKGSKTAYKSKAISEVNKFRNAMVGKADWCEASGNAFCVTRKGGGAVIVMKGSGNVSVTNGGGYCPAGTYTDKVSGGIFTVTSTTISGNVGSSGIAVIYDGDGGGGGDDDDDDDPVTDEHYVYFDGTSFSQPQVWAWNASGNCTTATEWPGDNMTKKNDKWYWAVPSGKSLPTMIIIHEGDNKIGGGDLVYVDHATYHQDGTYTASQGGGDDDTEFTIYYDNSVSNWSSVNIHYWSVPSTIWPGEGMTKVEGNIWKYTFPASPAGLSGFLFCNADGSDQTDDYTGAPINKHLYKGSGGKGAVTDEGVYDGGDVVSKPVVTATPGTSMFTTSVTVTLTVTPETDIYYTTNGTTPSASSSKYVNPLTFTETTTLKTYVKNEGGENVQTFTYTLRGQGGGDDPVPGDNLVTDYYKVNPDGKVGTNKTINMSFNDQRSTTALNNWTEDELIAQGVARDIAQAYKGNHERPVVDSYAIYAAYDEDYLYLGAQFVYTVWDLYGEGKQPGESKPYNMDGRMMWAFDLDPDASFDGYINGTGAIWNDNSAPGAKFNNGVDAVWLGSTKPGVGTPGFFIPTPDGHASYDAAYCKSIPGSYYGYADGLLPSIENVWGQSEFNGDPEALKGNAGFVDLRSEIDDDAHTFYEWKFPLSVLGVTADYIRDNGIGVMYLDVYGSSPVGGTPYDPAYFDNVKDSYSQDPSSSKEKEDEDIITYAPARVGKLKDVPAGITSTVDNGSNLRIYAAEGKVYVIAPEATTVTISTMSGMTITREVEAGMNVIDDLARGFYIINRVKVAL